MRTCGRRDHRLSSCFQVCAGAKKYVTWLFVQSPNVRRTLGLARSQMSSYFLFPECPPRVGFDELSISSKASRITWHEESSRTFEHGFRLQEQSTSSTTWVNRSNREFYIFYSKNFFPEWQNMRRFSSMSVPPQAFHHLNWWDFYVNT